MAVDNVTHTLQRNASRQTFQNETSDTFQFPSHSAVGTFEDTSMTHKGNLYLNSTLRPSLRATQRVCLAIFALEHTVRLLTSPNKRLFLRGFFNVVDVLTFLPMLALELIVGLYNDRLDNSSVFRVAFLLSLMGVFKVVRIVKFTLQYSIMRVLVLSLRASASHVALLLVLISIGMLLFSTLIYYAEFYTENFQSIPIGYWWAIVTMTTVGYGDTHPVTGWGYVVGSLCAVVGMISTGLPLPVIANNFNFYYKYARVHEFRRQRLNKRRSKRLAPLHDLELAEFDVTRL